MVPQVCSLGTKKDLNSMGSTMCGKRMSSFMVGNKKTLLSPTASLMRHRSQLFGKIATVQSQKIRHLKKLSKFQDLVIGEHMKSKAALKKGFNREKEQFKRLKTRHYNEDMEKKLKAAREERDKALTASWDAVELAEKIKMEFEQHKEEQNKNFKEENIDV